MNSTWVPAETTTHQDHVIAHVLETTVLGHFVLHDAAYFLLDIGFLWQVYINGDMGLLLHPIMVAELDLSEAVRDQIKTDIDLLLSEGRTATGLSQISASSFDCQITSVTFFGRGDERRLEIASNEGNLTLEASVTRETIMVIEDPLLADA